MRLAVRMFVAFPCRFVSIDDLKRKLPMPELLQKLGLSTAANKVARCPLHNDTRPSFGIYKNQKGEWKCKCFAGCVSGDEVDFIQAHKNCSRRDAINTYRELCGIPY